MLATGTSVWAFNTVAGIVALVVATHLILNGVLELGSRMARMVGAARNALAWILKHRAGLLIAISTVLLWARARRQNAGPLSDSFLHDAREFRNDLMSGPHWQRHRVFGPIGQISPPLAQELLYAWAVVYLTYAVARLVWRRPDRVRSVRTIAIGFCITLPVLSLIDYAYGHTAFAVVEIVNVVIMLAFFRAYSRASRRLMAPVTALLVLQAVWKMSALDGHGDRILLASYALWATAAVLFTVSDGPQTRPLFDLLIGSGFVLNLIGNVPVFFPGDLSGWAYVILIPLQLRAAQMFLRWAFWPPAPPTAGGGGPLPVVTDGPAVTGLPEQEAA